MKLRDSLDINTENNLIRAFNYTEDKLHLNENDFQSFKESVRIVLPQAKGFFKDKHWKFVEEGSYNDALEYYSVYIYLYDNNKNSYFHKYPILEIMLDYRKDNDRKYDHDHEIYKDYKTFYWADSLRIKVNYVNVRCRVCEHQQEFRNKVYFNDNEKLSVMALKALRLDLIEKIKPRNDN